MAPPPWLLLPLVLRREPFTIKILGTTALLMLAIIFLLPRLNSSSLSTGCYSSLLGLSFGWLVLSAFYLFSPKLRWRTDKCVSNYPSFHEVKEEHRYFCSYDDIPVAIVFCRFCRSPVAGDCLLI